MKIAHVVDSMEIGRDRAQGLGLGPEPQELGMGPVAPRQAPQDRLCQQGFPPQSSQPLPVKILGMDCPESHLPVLLHEDQLLSVEAKCLGLSDQLPLCGRVHGRRPGQEP